MCWKKTTTRWEGEKVMCRRICPIEVWSNIYVYVFIYDTYTIKYDVYIYIHIYMYILVYTYIYIYICYIMGKCASKGFENDISKSKQLLDFFSKIQVFSRWHMHMLNMNRYDSHRVATFLHFWIWMYYTPDFSNPCDGQQRVFLCLLIIAWQSQSQ